MKFKNRYIHFFTIALTLLFATSCYEVNVKESSSGRILQDEKYYVGTSLSYASYLERNSDSIFKENGVAKSPFQSVKDHGGNIVHLSLAFGPYVMTDADKAYAIKNSRVPPIYSIDYHSYERVLDDFHKAKDAGLEVFLSILYEKGLSGDRLNIPAGAQMEKFIGEYAKTTLEKFGSEGLYPIFVAIGSDYDNATNKGLFMGAPIGKDSANIMVGYMNAGFKAVKDFAAANNKKIKTVLHITSAGDVKDFLYRYYTADYQLDFDVLGISYNFSKGTGGFASLPELPMYMRIVYNKETFVVGASFSYSSSNADFVVNNYTRIDNKTYGTVQSPAIQKQMFIDFSKAFFNAGGLGVIAEGGDFTGSKVWFFGNPWNQGSDWDNNAFWDKKYELHEGIDWMMFDYQPFVKRNY